MNYVNIPKSKSKSKFLSLSINSFFINYFIIFFYNFFFIYIKKSKNLSAKYYQENKKDYKKAHEKYQNLSKEEKEKNGSMVMNFTKISQKMKNKSLLSIEKNIIE